MHFALIGNTTSIQDFPGDSLHANTAANHIRMATGCPIRAYEENIHLIGI